ncbi:MAG: Trp operon repressor [Gammaproteobacteria bacterium RIFCSPHIGHO2_12_FULL_35_23]|nr:MAG: Trp operon repressor [Gammaproteobacteria bacterium RIFCSPHIGHO2_12_FULL_35_23]
MKQGSESGWWQLIELIHQIKNKQQLEQFFQLLFTPEERHDLAKRMLIIKGLLAEKLTQRDLARALQVSIAKITRGSNALKMIDNSLSRLLKEN